MMATTHIIAGAAVARLGRRPWLSWPAAFASYLILDAMPHVNAEQFLHSPARGWVTLIDVIVGLIVVERLTRNHHDRKLMWGGVLVVVAVAVASNLSHALLWFSHSASTPLVPGPAQALRAGVQLLVLGWGLYVIVPGPSRAPAEAAAAD